MKKQILALVPLLFLSLNSCGHTETKEDIKELLGTDVNHNGIRDDVEDKINQKYKTKLHRAYMMDAAQVYQNILAQPVSKAEQTQKDISRIISCEMYLSDKDKYIDEHSPKLLDKIEEFTLNTEKRMKKYLDYNQALSGGSYGSGPSDWTEKACSEDVKKALREMGK